LNVFLALYAGRTLGGAKLLTITADHRIVRAFASRMLSEPVTDNDPVTLELERARRRALQLIQNWGQDEK
jgi:uncharacterized membrane protein